MIHFCPRCWHEIHAGADPCPHCGGTTSEDGTPFVERLLATLRHPDPTRAGLAIDILAGRLHEPRSVAALIELLSESQDLAVLVQAARGLGLLGDRAAVAPLARVLSNTEMAFVVRGEAASALGRLGGEGAVAALQAMVNDPMDSVSRRARQALAFLRAEGGT